MNSEHDESQTTPSENDNEQREGTGQNSSNSQSGMVILTTPPLVESEIVPIETEKSPVEATSKFIFAVAYSFVNGIYIHFCVKLYLN